MAIYVDSAMLSDVMALAIMALAISQIGLGNTALGTTLFKKWICQYSVENPAILVRYHWQLTLGEMA